MKPFLLFGTVFVIISAICLKPAFADCTNPAGPAGFVFYNEDVNAIQYCNGTHWVAMGAINPAAGSGTCANPTAPERTMIYNDDYSVMQFCNGQDWIAIGPYPVPTGTLIGPSGCVNIGDLCADGTVFAGYHPVTHEHLFVPTNDQGAGVQWKTSTGTDDIAVDSAWDGRVNTNSVPNDPMFPSFKLCKDLATGGHADWYLPSRVELFYLWTVRGTIEAGGNITNFLNAAYWTSSELDSNVSHNVSFTSGQIGNGLKTNGYRIRCVRR